MHVDRGFRLLALLLCPHHLASLFFCPQNRATSFGSRLPDEAFENPVPVLPDDRTGTAADDDTVAVPKGFPAFPPGTRSLLAKCVLVVTSQQAIELNHLPLLAHTLGCTRM